MKPISTDPIAPRSTGKLILPGLAENLARQDAERAAARKNATSASFFRDFGRSVAYELMLAHKWGAEADVANNEIVRSITEKYPPRKPGRFIQWLFQFRNKLGAPIFQYNPAPLGFIFNEGGRGVTLTLTRMIPFRLYLGGWVLMYRGREWSLTNTKGKRRVLDL